KRLSGPCPGHIGGTSHYDLARIDEKYRDLNRRSDRTSGMFAVVRDMPAPDPAYRPAHPLTPRALRLGVLRTAELEGDHDLRDAAEQGEETDPDQQERSLYRAVLLG